MCWWRRGEGAGWRGGREAHQNVTFLIVVQFATKKKSKYREHLHGTSIRGPVELCFALYCNAN